MTSSAPRRSSGQSYSSFPTEVRQAVVSALFNALVDHAVDQLGVQGDNASGENFEENPAVQAECQGGEGAVDFLDREGEFGEVRGFVDRNRMCWKGEGGREFQKTLY